MSRTITIRNLAAAALILLSTASLVACECTTTTDSAGRETTVCGDFATGTPAVTGEDDRADHRCGPSFGDAVCGEGRCCSAFGWCGGPEESHCGYDNGYGGAYDGPELGSGFGSGSSLSFEPDGTLTNAVASYGGTWDYYLTLEASSASCEGDDDMPAEMTAIVDQADSSANMTGAAAEVTLTNANGTIVLDGHVSGGELGADYVEAGDGFEISIFLAMGNLSSDGTASSGLLFATVSMGSLECERQYRVEGFLR